MKYNGLNFIEEDFEPDFGTCFLFNMKEGWNFNLFIYECCNPQNRNKWFGYYADQRKEDKFRNNKVNLKGILHICKYCKCLISLVMLHQLSFLLARNEQMNERMNKRTNKLFF